MTDRLDLSHPDAASVISGSEVKKLGYSLYLKIPDNRLECRCSYAPHDIRVTLHNPSITLVSCPFVPLWHTCPARL